MIKLDRRRLLKMTAAGAGAAGAGVLAGRASLASYLVHPHKDSLSYLDRNSYIQGLKVHATFSDIRGSKTQMMTIGEKRFFFARGSVFDGTNPLEPKLINSDAYPGGQIQVAYNKKAGKWILFLAKQAPFYNRNQERPFGKWSDPSIIDRVVNSEGLRGAMIYDCSDPYNLKLLSKWSVDQGDPERPVQTGSGSHRPYYDGGKYAYLSGSPNNNFTKHMEMPDAVYAWGMQIIDIEDPSNPKFVSNWWVPGQHDDEVEEYKLWRESGDQNSFTCLHSVYVPKRVEEGGRYCYAAYGSFGSIILDISDPTKPKQVSVWRPPYLPGTIPFHTVTPVWVDNRNLLIATAESLNSDCYEAFVHNYVLDLEYEEINGERIITGQRKISEFGRWEAPEDAPYDDFCNSNGRMGTHNPPHLKAPGKAHSSWMAFSAFNGGLQVMDFSDPEKPRRSAYFVPARSGSLDNPRSYYRLGESVFVEWDRNVIWFGSNHGYYIMSDPALGEPIFDAMPVKEWSLPGLNEGI